MEKVIEWFYEISVYLNAIPIFVGVYFYRYLSKSQQSFLIFSGIAFVLSILSQVLAHFGSNTHWIYYIAFFVGFINYALFFSNTIPIKRLPKIFIGLLIFSLILIIYDLLQNGVRNYFVLPFLILDILLIPFAFVLFVKFAKNHSIKILSMGILIYLVFDLASTILTNYFYDYFQNKVFYTIFFGISPVFLLIFMFFQSYSYYLASKEVKPSFDKILDFRETV